MNNKWRAFITKPQLSKKEPITYREFEQKNQKLKKEKYQIFKITQCTCELLDPKIEKSPTCSKFENFDPHPQLDIKFLNP